MKTVILLMLAANVSMASTSKTATKRYMDHEFKAITQKQAIVILASNPGAVVYVMTELELSDKGILKVKRESK